MIDVIVPIVYEYSNAPKIIKIIVNIFSSLLYGVISPYPIEVIVKTIK
jgi:hypothetical protein